MFEFKIKATLQHDQGESNLNIVSVTEKYNMVEALEKALVMIKSAENCPDNAITKIVLSLNNEN